ncbi:hypothetical protein HW555_002973 [Spodoptera exigua]|uniref:Uncharacterized protein n=1 Tax=Spodoptera exigua TaxID=7107 RepID=A0A835GNV1_SPOEX|nr:hypothetical protein HW555_002973 [Spodoptera exigua]
MQSSACIDFTPARRLCGPRPPVHRRMGCAMGLHESSDCTLRLFFKLFNFLYGHSSNVRYFKIACKSVAIRLNCANVDDYSYASTGKINKIVQVEDDVFREMP